MKFYLKMFFGLLSVTGILLTLYVVYKMQYAKEKPAWFAQFQQRMTHEVIEQEIRRKGYIEKIKNCMESAKICEEHASEQESLSCDKNKFHLFFRCVGIKKDERVIVPVESDYH